MIQEHTHTQAKIGSSQQLAHSQHSNDSIDCDSITYTHIKIPTEANYITTVEGLASHAARRKDATLAITDPYDLTALNVPQHNMHRHILQYTHA